MEDKGKPSTATTLNCEAPAAIPHLFSWQDEGLATEGRQMFFKPVDSQTETCKAQAEQLEPNGSNTCVKKGQLQ